MTRAFMIALALCVWVVRLYLVLILKQKELEDDEEVS